MGVLNKKARLVLSVTIILSLICVFLFFGFKIVFASDYSEDLNLEISESTQYKWILQNPGELTSLRLNGISSGITKAYIENDNKKYLIFSLNNSDETNFELCVDTCDLTGFNKNAYNIIFEVETKFELIINKIVYSIKEEVKETTFILPVGENDNIELSIEEPVEVDTVDELIDLAPDILIVKKCPGDFDDYKEEYGLSKGAFKELFEACFVPTKEELIQKKLKENKLMLRPKDIPYIPEPVSDDHISIKIPKNIKRISKEEAKNFLKQNKNSIEWVKSAKQWKNKLTKDMPQKNTVAYYIKLHKLSVIKKLKKQDIL